jgi:putative YhbY family RNA-binding protein
MPALTATPAQRAALRAQAHALKPVVLIGAEGLTEAVMAEIERNLVAHELIKIRVFGDDRDARLEAYATICDRLSAAPVQHIGKLLVLYRPAPQAHAALPTAGRLQKTARPSAGAMPDEPAQAKGRAPRVVKVVKPSDVPMRKPKKVKIVVRGNERVTAGGNIKRAKPKQTSAKRAHQSNK